MSLKADNWKNKGGTSNRKCNCGSWKKHWEVGTGKSFPAKCSVYGCSNKPVLGAHIINKDEDGEWIIPACSSCNQLSDEFDLKSSITLYSANKSKTCES